MPEPGTFGVEIERRAAGDRQERGRGLRAREFCTHEEVSLVDGEVYDCTVECWLHGSCFDLSSGKPTGPPATKPLTTYQVRVDGDDVYVAVPSS